MRKHLLLFVLILLPMVVNAKNANRIDGVWYYLDRDTKQAEVTYGSKHILYKYTGEVFIPELVTYDNKNYIVTSIGQNAFSGCSGLTSITIPNSVTSIGEYAFSGCSGLTSITIPNSVTSIGQYAFYGCSGLTSITIPNSVTSIGQCAFMKCSGLTTVILSNRLTKISANAFDHCSSLTSVTIPNRVTKIEQQAFYGCTGLTSVTIPDDLWNIDFEAFYGCTGLISVTIPNDLGVMGDKAFYGCSSLTSVTIGKKDALGMKAFEGADIPTIISLCENPSPMLGKTSKNRTFSQNTFNNATLYVPKGTINKYKATQGWMDFVHIKEGTPTGINVVENTKDKKTVIYDLNGVRQYEPKKGINIINGKKYVKK